MSGKKWWPETEAYKLLDEFRNATFHRQVTYALSSLGRAFASSDFDGSIEQLKAVAYGEKKYKGVGESATGAARAALRWREERAERMLNDALGWPLEILQLCAIPPGWRVCYIDDDCSPFGTPVMMGALVRSRERPDFHPFIAGIVSSEDGRLEPVTLGDLGFVAYLGPGESMDAPHIVALIEGVIAFQLEKKLAGRLVKELGYTEVDAEHKVWDIYEPERKADLDAILAKLDEEKES